jgi:hypothetical protein
MLVSPPVMSFNETFFSESWVVAWIEVNRQMDMVKLKGAFLQLFVAEDQKIFLFIDTNCLK